MVAAEIQTGDPAALAATWGAAFGRDIEVRGGVPTLPMDDAVVRFVPVQDGRGEGLGGLDIVAKDRDHIFAAAKLRGLEINGDVVMACGMRFKIV